MSRVFTLYRGMEKKSSGKDCFTVLIQVIFSDPSQLSLCDQLFFPVISKSFDLLLSFLGQFQQTQPLGYSVGRYPMPFSKLFSGKIVTDQLIIQFSGIYQRVTVGLFVFADRNVHTLYTQCFGRFG